MQLTNFHNPKNYLYSKPIKGLSGCEVGYRFSFNGKEDDEETQTQDYGFRIYNSNTGKFLSVDPLTKKFPMLTPYQFASNNPIMNIDLDGLEGIIATQVNSGVKITDASVKLFNHQYIIHTLRIVHTTANGESVDVSFQVLQSLNYSFNNWSYAGAFAIKHPQITNSVCNLAGIVDPGCGAEALGYGKLGIETDRHNSVVGYFTEQTSPDQFEKEIGGGIGKTFRHQVYSGLLSSIYGKEMGKEITDVNEMGGKGTFGITNNGGITGINDLVNNAWGVKHMDSYVKANGEINNIKQFASYLTFVAEKVTEGGGLKKDANVTFTEKTKGVAELYKKYSDLKKDNKK